MVDENQHQMFSPSSDRAGFSVKRSGLLIQHLLRYSKAMDPWGSLIALLLFYPNSVFCEAEVAHAKTYTFWFLFQV